MTAKTAEIIALKALSYILENPDSRKKFIDNTGMDGSTLSNRIKDKDHLCGILDYILSNEELLIRFCEHLTLPPEVVQRASRTLSAP